MSVFKGVMIFIDDKWNMKLTLKKHMINQDKKHLPMSIEVIFFALTAFFNTPTSSTAPYGY